MVLVDDIRATPTDLRVTHDLKLTDGVTGIGLILCNSRGIPIGSGAAWTLRQTGSTRTSLQIFQGDPDYSTYQLPYTPVTQKDWSGGRGNEDFEDDKTRYYDCENLDARMGDIILAGKPTQVNLQTNTSNIESFPLTGSEIGLSGSGIQIASNFVAPADATFSSIALLVSPGVQCTVSVIKDALGVPSSDPADIVATATLNVPALVLSGALYGAAVGEFAFGAQEIGHGLHVSNPLQFVLASIAMAGGLIASQTYWVVVVSNAVGYGADTGSMIKTYSGGTWSTYLSDYSIYFSIASVSQGICRFFEYKGALYALLSQDNGTQSLLFLNGYRFTAASGSTQTAIKVPAGITLTINELAGCILRVVGGKCYTENPNYKTIVSNTTDTIYLDDGFLNTPDNTSDMVILGLDKWTQITSTGLGAAVTDIVVANNIVYFAQGESTNIRRMREYNSSGTWTREFADDGTNKATFMIYLPNHKGQNRIWKFNNPASGAPTAAYAEPQNWGTNLDFVTKPTELGADVTYPIPIGDPRSKITGVVGYGDPIIPHVFKEDEFGSIANGIYAKFPISEMAQVRNIVNGSVSIQFGVYLFFNVLDGWERFYENRLDDIGFNRDEGLPPGRQGNISAVVSYPGGLYLSVDAGGTGYSSIMYWNQIGYHEIYRAPYGHRIRSLYIQTLPGRTLGKLWVGLSDKTAWIPVTLNPRKHADYQYASSGTLVSSWLNGNFREINKFWKSVQLYGEGLSSGQKIEAYYQTDNEGDADDWHKLPVDFTSSPMQEVTLSNNLDVYGKRWRYKLALSTNDPTKTPRVKAVTVPSVTRLPINSAWNVTVLADDALVDRQGKQQAMTAKELLDQLTVWADSNQSPTPLTMHSPVAAFHNKRVFIEPPSVIPVEVVNEKKKRLKAVINLTVYEA